MSQDVMITFSPNDAGVIAYLQKQNAEMLKNQERLLKLGEAGKKAGKELTMSFDPAHLKDFAGGLGVITTGAGAMAAAFKLAHNEWQNLKSAQKDSAKANVSLGVAMAQAAGALGADAMTPVELERNIQAISGRTGVSQVALATSATDLLSARGEKSAAEALAALESAANVAALQTEALSTLGASALDISKATGQTPDQAIGQLMSIATAARVTNLKGVAENVAPAVIGVSKFGDTPKEAGALVAAITQGTVDPTGATSRTSAISFAEQLQAFLPALGSTTARMEALQNDQKLAGEFLDKGSFEKSFVTTARGLLSANPQAPERLALESARKTVLQGPEAEAKLNDFLSSLKNLESVRTARFDQSLKAGAERLQTVDVTGAEGSIGREALVEILKSTGSAKIVQDLSLGKYELGTMGGTLNPRGTLIEAIEQRRKELTTPERLWEQAPTGFGDTPFQIGPQFSEVTPRQQRQAAELGVLIELLKAQGQSNDAAMQKQTEVLTDIAKSLGSAGPAAPRPIGRTLTDPGRPPRPRPSSLLSK